MVGVTPRPLKVETKSPHFLVQCTGRVFKEAIINRVKTK